MIDTHSHILPNIDDGSRSLEESIQMIREAYESGFTDIISTSHYIEESYFATKVQREELINIIEDKLKEENIDVKIHNGAEIYVSLNLVQLIRAGKIPTINNSKYILMELPMHSEIIYLDNIISNLMSNGLIPIIAHPERYDYVKNNYKYFEKYIEKGVLLQSNYGSIIGLHGTDAEKTVKKLLKKDMVEFLGTDVHRSNDRYIYIKEITKKLEKLIGKEKLEKLSYTNIKKLIFDDESNFVK